MIYNLRCLYRNAFRLTYYCFCGKEIFMKKYKTVICLLAIFVLLAFVFSACSKPEQSTDDVCAKGFNIYLYDNILYYYDTNTFSIKYQDLTNVQTTGLPLYGDVLASGEENPFANIFSPAVYFAVDPKATKENDNRHVLIGAYYRYAIDKQTNRMKNFYQITSFDTGTNKVTVIQDEIAENIQSLCIYGDRIIYTTNEGDLGTNIHIIGKDGSGYKEMENPDKDSYRVQTVYKDRIYFIDAAGRLFSCSLDLDDRQYLFDIVLRAEMFIVNDRIVYCDNLLATEFDGASYMTVDIVSCPISDTSKKEKLLSDVSMGMNCGDKFYYYISEPRKIGSAVEEYSHILYEYSFETGLSREVYDLGDKEISRCYTAIGENYIVYTETDYSSGSPVSRRIAQNLKTGEETEVPK